METLVQLHAKPRALIDRGIEIDTAIAELLAADAPVAVGVSGGKDSCAAAIATVEHLRAIGHKGPVVLVHADLGDDDPRLNVEWADSLPTCERLAAFLGIELIVVKRPAGGMMKRWQSRWANNVDRYAKLRCVKIILPWSTPSMRFCTSELKSAPIASTLVKRFPGRQIVSACGIRREEGNGKSQSPRTNAETSKPNKRLTNKRLGTSGVDWNPIAAWTEADVFAFCAARGFQMHEGYAMGMKRISCRFCIMQDESDQRVSASVPENQPVLHTIVQLEAQSTFAFQGSRWLADISPYLLNDSQREAIRLAKARAQWRTAAEDRIPDHLLYTEGWPTVMPTMAEAILLAEVRREIATIMEFQIGYTEPQAILDRYAELMAENARRAAEKKRKASRKQKRARKGALS